MHLETPNLISSLNNHSENERLIALSSLVTDSKISNAQSNLITKDVNNHIHTWYSFSPYSPSKAIWQAYKSGLQTAGIMDHDSVAGAIEFQKAGKIAGIATTTGIECRADFSTTPLKGKLINNPDQKSIAYVAIHGISQNNINKVDSFFSPYRKKRNIRNQNMTHRLNQFTTSYDLSLDFEKDILPLSKHDKDGAVTERHILFGLSLKIIAKYGKGERLLEFLQSSLKVKINQKVESFLLDPLNEFYEYDLLGLLKSELVQEFYIDATPECPDIKDVLALSEQIGAISAYAYLGDVTESVTGDKKAQKFEDEYLDLLFETLKNLGFRAVTYMPSRNTYNQLLKIKKLCHDYDFFEISGEDINSPRQSFICLAQRDDFFSNLYDSTWALIGHEFEVSKDTSNGLFSKKMVSKYGELQERISFFKKIGRKVNGHAQP